MKAILYILIGISTLAACSGNQKSTFPRYTDFPETKAIKAQVADLDTILLRYPFRVAVRNSIAVVVSYSQNGTGVIRLSKSEQSR